MESAPFFVERDETNFTATITLSRPDQGNRLMTEDVSALGQAIRECGADPAVKAVIIRAQGEHFCLGRDPGPAAAKPKSALAMRTGVTQPILDLYADIRATPVPVVAVVQGEARGFGCAMVGQCDLSIAAEGTQFSLPEMDTNLPPTLAISAVLGKCHPSVSCTSSTQGPKSTRRKPWNWAFSAKWSRRKSWMPRSLPRWPS
jgi:enoyl-CoA hydratase